MVEREIGVMSDWCSAVQNCRPHNFSDGNSNVWYHHHNAIEGMPRGPQPAYHGRPLLLEGNASDSAAASARHFD